MKAGEFEKRKRPRRARVRTWKDMISIRLDDLVSQAESQFPGRTALETIDRIIQVAEEMKSRAGGGGSFHCVLAYEQTRQRWRQCPRLWRPLRKWNRLAGVILLTTQGIVTLEGCQRISDEKQGANILDFDKKWWIWFCE
jgi:hypothetical protein